MGDKIEFPFNNEMYLKEATICIEKDDYEQALTYIEKAYEIDRSYSSNYFYTFILFTLEKYEEALEIANNYKDFYLKNDEHTPMYTMILIKNHLFLEAEVIIQQHNEEGFSLYQQEWKKIEQELNAERERFNLEIEMNRKIIKNKLAQINNYSLTEQIQIIVDAHALTLEDLQEVAVQIFNNPFIAGQIQRGFLEVLIEKDDKNYYMFPWFNQMKKICPKELKVFNELPILQQINYILEDKLQKTPHLIETIKVEIMNDLLLLYPFIEETITDLDYWINLYIIQLDKLNQLNIDTTPICSEQEKLEQWMEQLNQIAQRK